MVLYDPETDQEFSDHAGDYWAMKPDDIFKNASGDNLWLMKNGKVIKKTVRRRDLRDHIYDAQKKQRAIINKRKSVGRGYYALNTDDGESFVLTSKGLITQRHNFYHGGESAFSGQWALRGVTMRWNSRDIIPWDEVLAHPELYKGAYIFDLDNGTLRQWGGRRIKSLYKAKELDKIAQAVKTAGGYRS